jgi:hypothetical protein
MSHLIKDPKDLLPYIDTLLQALKVGVSDSLTEVRAASSKAIGFLASIHLLYIIDKLGETYGYLVLTMLLELLDDEKTTTVERAGAA